MSAMKFTYDYLAWTCKVNLVSILVVVPVVTSSCMHTTFLGSGSHSPFPIHIDELGPLSDDLDGQVNVMLSPSSAGSS